jgi:hypothetical protein
LEPFWAAHPADFGAGQAWRQGAKWSQDSSTAAVFHNGRIFGFSFRPLPQDRDRAVQSRLNLAYAQRAELEAIQAAGLFAFSVFECPALAEYSRLNPDLGLCRKMEVEAKMSGDWSGRAFGVARLPVPEICACRKALDRGQGENNAGTFFGAVARQELSRLHGEGRPQAVADFFFAHYKKKVFLAPELLMAAEALAEGGKLAEALVLLDALTERFAPDLTSREWEQCGDLYYKAGREEPALKAYLKAGETLHN